MMVGTVSSGRVVGTVSSGRVVGFVMSVVIFRAVMILRAELRR